MIDAILKGGFVPGYLYVIYGKAGSGKSTLALQLLASTMKKGYKALYIDAMGKIPPRIATNLLINEIKEMRNKGFILMMTSFQELYRTIISLEVLLIPSLRVIIIDTLTRLYRAELGSKAINIKLNKMMNRMLATLFKLTRYYRVLVMATADIRYTPESGREVPVAFNILDYWADVIIKLEGRRGAGRGLIFIEKHYDKELKGRRAEYIITDRGLRGVRAF